MAAAFPYEIKIPSQGVIRKFDDKSQLAEFVENEAKFFREVSGLLSGSLVHANMNYRNLNLPNEAARLFDDVKRGLENDNFQPLDQYVESAENLQILVAQGRMGSRVKDLLKGPGQQEARWMTLLLCSNWTGGEPDKILDPFRAALFANPAIFSFGDLITATDAMDRSSVALSTIEQARVDLNAFIQAKTDLFEKLEELYRSK